MFISPDWVKQGSTSLGFGGHHHFHRHSCVFFCSEKSHPEQHQRFRSEENGCFSEAQSQLLFLQLMQAVEYMHLGIPGLSDRWVLPDGANELRWRPTSHFFNPFSRARCPSIGWKAPILSVENILKLIQPSVPVVFLPSAFRGHRGCFRTMKLRHSKRVIHRDIKAENLFISPLGSVSGQEADFFGNQTCQWIHHRIITWFARRKPPFILGDFPATSDYWLCHMVILIPCCGRLVSLAWGPGHQPWLSGKSPHFFNIFHACPIQMTNETGDFPFSHVWLQPMAYSPNWRLRSLVASWLLGEWKRIKRFTRQKKLQTNPDFMESSSSDFQSFR